ncbi:hypothetical protein AB4Y96_07130 [Phyllobacterium sp. TAF24]|uniref:hypothetical protein n=1 Tax=unclassified Phyllobacterium TaxID=2638441 RepID=UPI000883168E|nr:hypothetical protein [Phyllobacterium sp. OV277]SDO35776.1 hypothetical protein SAMN05443582_1022 [Phyllobacterium sp. OV277]
MNDYNFWAHLLDTFQASPDLIKAIWLLIPPVFVLGLLALTLRFRIDSKLADKAPDGELVYSVHRDKQNRVHIISHTKQLEGSSPLLLLDPVRTDQAEPDLIDK